MAKPTYLVTVIRQGKEALYSAFLKSRQRQPGAASYPPDDELAFVEEIRASNRREAMVLARSLHPGHDIAPRIAKHVARPGLKRTRAPMHEANTSNAAPEGTGELDFCP